MTTHWRTRANCANTNFDDFFNPSRADDTRAICNACPVKTECLNEALRNNISDGMWGGLTEDERNAIAPRSTPANAAKDDYRKMTPELADEVLALTKQGHNRETIAKQLRVSTTAVQKVRRAGGFVAPKHRSQREPGLVEDVLDLSRQGLSLTDTAKRARCSRATVVAIREKHLVDA